MKLIKTIATATAIGASFIASNPAEARNGWLEAACNYSNECLYIKKNGGSYPIIYYKWQVTGGRSIQDSRANCNTWQRISAVNGNWHDVMPGTLNDGAMRILCK